MIPYTEYVLPNGDKRQGSFDRPPEIEKMAHALIEDGYRFEAEVLTTGEASLSIVRDDRYGDPEDVDIELAHNALVAPEAFDRLVKRTYAVLLRDKEKPEPLRCILMGCSHDHNQDLVPDVFREHMALGKAKERNTDEG